MQENHQINKYMIEFAEHVAFTGWNDVALCGEFYCRLAEQIKDQLLNFNQPPMLNKLKINMLKCNNQYWERQHEKGPVPLSSHTKSSTTTVVSTLSTQLEKAFSSSRQSNPSGAPRKDLGNILGMDGKLTEVEKER